MPCLAGCIVLRGPSSLKLGLRLFQFVTADIWIGYGVMACTVSRGTRFLRFLTIFKNVSLATVSACVINSGTRSKFCFERSYSMTCLWINGKTLVSSLLALVDWPFVSCLTVLIRFLPRLAIGWCWFKVGVRISCMLLGKGLPELSIDVLLLRSLGLIDL